MVLSLVMSGFHKTVTIGPYHMSQVAYGKGPDIKLDEILYYQFP